MVSASDKIVVDKMKFLKTILNFVWKCDNIDRITLPQVFFHECYIIMWGQFKVTFI